MKRTISITLAILLPLAAFAAKVDVKRARTLAENFFRQGGVSSISLKMAPTGGDYYIFNNASGGFVIISAEDSTVPVLAYSFQDNIDTEDTSPALRTRLDLYSKNIRQAAQKRLQPSKEVRLDWDNLSNQTKASVHFSPVVELETARWDQYAPYNKLCPMVDGGRSVTGCGPTATAIVMRYYKWPERGSGHTPDYDYVSDKGTQIHITGIDLGHNTTGTTCLLPRENSRRTPSGRPWPP